MKRKFLSLALCIMMVLSFMVVPASAEGEVTLLESWFVNTATSAKVYDTLAEATVKPAFYVNNETGAAIEGAKLVLASYDASGKLASVNYTAAPTIAMGESKVTTTESIDVSVGGETYMMIWDAAYAPVVPKTELTTDSRDARITSFTIGDAEGVIAEENNMTSYVSSAVKKTNSYEKSIFVFVPAASEVDLTADVTPEIEIPTGATISPAKGTPVNFANGAVEYTVTAADGVTSHKYTVTALKSDIKLYQASIGEDFPVITYDDLTAETAVTGRADNGTTGTTVAKAYNNTASWWSNSKTSTGKLYYTRKQIESNKYAPLRPDEQLSDYYISDGTALVTEGSEADTDICYVMKKNADESLSYVLTSDYAVVPDPTNNENLVLRFDKRGESDSSPNSIAHTIRYSGTSTGNPTHKTVNVMKYSYDLYVPKTNEQSLYMTIGYHTKTGAAATSPYNTAIRRSGDDLEFLIRRDKDVYPVIATVKNAFDKWHDIDAYVIFESGTTTSYLMLCCDGKVIAKTDMINGGGTASNSIYASGYAKGHMTFSAAGTSARGTYYIDNFDVELESAF